MGSWYAVLVRVMKYTRKQANSLDLIGSVILFIKQLLWVRALGIVASGTILTTQYLVGRQSGDQVNLIFATSFNGSP